MSKIIKKNKKSNCIVTNTNLNDHLLVNIQSPKSRSPLPCVCVFVWFCVGSSIERRSSNFTSFTLFPLFEGLGSYKLNISNSAVFEALAFDSDGLINFLTGPFPLPGPTGPLNLETSFVSLYPGSTKEIVWLC